MNPQDQIENPMLPWDLEEEEWDVSYAPDMLLEIGTHFRTEIEDMLSEGAAKDE